MDYVYKVEASSYIKSGEASLGNAKNILVTVSYSYKGENYSVSLKSLKVEEL